MSILKRYGIVVPIAILFAAMGQSIGSPAPTNTALLIFAPLIVGAILGAIGALGRISEHNDWTTAVGVIILLLAGSVGICAPVEKARLFVPYLSIGAIVGFIGLVVALAVSPDDTDHDDYFDR